MSGNRQVSVRNLDTKPRPPKFRIPNLLRVIGLKNFAWIIILGGCAFSLHFFGTPHMLFDYRYVGSKNTKTDCTYLGLHSQTVPARDGDCPIMILLKSTR